MSPLELKRVEVELMQVTASRHALELKVAERLDEVERIKESIKIQLAKEVELAAKIKENK